MIHKRDIIGNADPVADFDEPRFAPEIRRINAASFAHANPHGTQRADHGGLGAVAKSQFLQEVRKVHGSIQTDGGGEWQDWSGRKAPQWCERFGDWTATVNSRRNL